MRVIRNVGELASLSLAQPDSGPTARFGGFDYPVVSLDNISKAEISSSGNVNLVC